MQLFYTPDINSTLYELNEIESKHCSKVLRLGKGNEIHLTDGKGNLFRTKIIDINPKKTTVEVTETIKKFEKRNFYLHIAIAPTKNIDRFEFFLEKATEIGIDEITPLLSERSERKIIKLERLNKILIAAMKQSIKAYLPKLNPMISFEKFVTQSFQEQKYIAHCDEGQKIKLKQAYSCGKNALILIGPEGDFSPNEIELSIANKLKTISLGNSRLRTETAGIAACHTINLLNELPH